MRRVAFSLLVLAASSVVSAVGPAPAPPLPEPCKPFSTKGGQPTECAVKLYAGYTYVMYTDCKSVKGDTQLTLRDRNGVDVAFNDGFPFCPGDTSASLVEFSVDCGRYDSSAMFTLFQDCYEDTECSGSVLIEYSSKEEPVDCGRPFKCTRQDEVCEALGDLYYATNGAHWYNRGGWKDAASGIPTSYCNFQINGGIPPPCDVDGFFVTLALESNNLTGTIPPNIGRLSRLESWLGFAGNFLTGSIPDSLSKLTTLTGTIDLSSNFLSGTIPATIGSLSLLKVLSLHDLRLHGSLPSGFNSLALDHLCALPGLLDACLFFLTPNSQQDSQGQWALRYSSWTSPTRGWPSPELREDRVSLQDSWAPHHGTEIVTPV